MTTCVVQAAGSIELYFYGELDGTAREQTEQHLAACAECRQALEELAVIRTALSTRPDVSGPSGGDWTAFMTGLDAAIRLDRETVGAAGAQTSAAPEQAYATAAPGRHYVAYIAMAALLTLVTTSVGLIVRSRVSTTVGGVATSAGTPRDGAAWTDDEAFASLSEQHFDRAKLVVLGLANKEPGEGLPAEWDYERGLASTLLADTRLYRLAAEDRGMTQLARIMGDLELVLLQASLSQDPQPETLAQIQNLIRKRDLVTRMAAAF